MDTGEAVVDEEDEESDALFTMDDLVEGAADAKRHNTDEVNYQLILLETFEIFSILFHI